MKNRIAGFAVCASVACIPSLTCAAMGADSPFPNRPVLFIVPTAPGGGLDFVARSMMQQLSERWGQAVVVDNRAGATGLIALEILARAAPDGHTLALLNPAEILSAQLSGRLSFDRGGDFTPIAHPATTELLLVVNPGVPAKSLKELVALARAKPRDLNYASGGTGTAPHLAMELFASVAGIEMTHVPYKGGGASYPDLVSGRVQLSLATIAAMTPYLQAGRVRALAVTGTKRAPAVPEVPTFAEAGYPRFQVSLWYGIFAPARMPASIVARLNADFNWVVQQPEVIQRLTGAGINPAGGSSPAQFADYVATETVKWNDALKAARMR